MTPPTWTDRLDELLDAGAELAIRTDDGDLLLQAGLARHWRWEATEPPLLWLRPLLGVARDDAGRPVVEHTLTRRRALTVLGARLEQGQVCLDLTDGLAATISLTTARRVQAVLVWDDYMSSLPAELELELDRLESDT